MSWPIVPVGQFVLKVHSRCDLACDHCYVYQSADQSWHGRPMGLSDEVISQAAERIAEHAASHQLPIVQVILHGGEPLLAGAARLQRIISALQSAVVGVCRLDLRIHTNGVLLNEKFCELFAEHGVKVGISLDGDRAANDRHRRYADGRSSFGQALHAIELLRTRRFRHLYSGLLCTIDVANDPLAVYSALADLDPPLIDFLLPHATWDNPPARPSGAQDDYAAWLIAIFDRWIADGQPIRIRTFESIISTLNGGGSLTEALGLGPSNLVVIETDGTYEQADSLKAAFDGAPVTGFDVFRHPLDVVARHPGIVARQLGLAGLSSTCQQCPVVATCGGGLYAHRYRTGTAFDNPSVYCPDLLKLITHIRDQQPRPADPPESPTHGVTAKEFRALAGGFGDAAAIDQLAQAQRSLGRGLLGAVYQAAMASALAATVTADLQTAWALLTRIDTEHPQVLDAVISHPYVRVWAVQCLTQLRETPAGRADGEHATGESGLDTDLGHLGAIAAVGAIRAGVSARVTIPIMDEAVHLPTLGRLMTGRAQPVAEPDSGSPAARRAAQRAALEVQGGVVTVVTDDSRWTLATSALLGEEAAADAKNSVKLSPDWQPVRRLSAAGISITLEDTDPYRDCHQWQPATRLTDAEFARWQGHFECAWQKIQLEHPAYAPALVEGLSTLMPLSAGTDGRDVSAAARHAFGAVAAALPADPVTLALLLIHEFQHVKLGAVLDLYDLYDQSDSREFHAPWRDDPRPLEGLLQGTYAHLAVTDFWRARYESTAGATAEEAGRRFAHWHAHTRDAIDALANSGSMTPLGMQFVDEMRHSAALGLRSG